MPLIFGPATTTAPGLLSAVDKLSLNNVNARIFRPGDYQIGNTYDPTGSSDSTSSFTAMMTAVNAFNDRCVVHMPVGVFKCNTGVLNFTSTAPQAIIGEDRGTCVLIPTSATGDMIKFASGAGGATVQNLSIFQTGTPQTAGAGINTNGANDVLISNVSFTNLFNDVFVNGSSIKVNITHTEHNQTNGSSTSVGVLVTNGLAGDTYIGPDCVMSNTGATRRRACVEVVQSGHFEVNQCNLTGSVQGILIDPGAAQIVGFGFINETLCDSCTTNGMMLNASTSTSTIKSIHTVNSWFSGTVSGGGAGVVTQGVAGGVINGVSHTSDRMLNNQTHGYQHGFGTDFQFVNCEMRGNSAATNNTSDGLNVVPGVSNWSVYGGKYGGSDTVSTAVNQRWGISVAAGAGDKIVLSPADCSGNVTGPISQNATGLNIHTDRYVGYAPIYTNPATGTVTSSTTETVLMSCRIPAGSSFAGQTFDIDLFGISSSTGTLLFKIKAGAAGTTADNQAWTHTVTAAQVANTRANLHGKLIVTANGASGTCKAEAFGFASGVVLAFAAAVSANTTAFSMNADWFVTVTCTCSVGTFTILTGAVNPIH